MALTVEKKVAAKKAAPAKKTASKSAAATKTATRKSPAKKTAAAKAAVKKSREKTVAGGADPLGLFVEMYAKF